MTDCTKVGPGCDNCYAERFAERWRGILGQPYEQGFDLTLWPSRLKQPVLWKKPRMIFVNSMSDLFHKDIDRKFVDAVFDAMEQADWHVYQVLTKRSSLTRLSRRAGKPGRQQRGLGIRARPQQEGWTGMSEFVVKAMSDLYSNVSFGGGGGGGGGTYGRPNATSRYTGNSCTVRGAARSTGEGAVIGGVTGAAGGAASGAVVGGVAGAPG